MRSAAEFYMQQTGTQIHQHCSAKCPLIMRSSWTGINWLQFHLLIGYICSNKTSSIAWIAACTHQCFTYIGKHKLTPAQSQHEQNTDKNVRTTPSFAPGQLVYLDELPSVDFHTRDTDRLAAATNNKVMPNKKGPFPIDKLISGSKILN